MIVEPGMGMPIEIEGVHTNVRSHLVGIEYDRFLILAMPETKIPGGISYKFAPGKFIVVRYLHRGTVYGFESQVIEVITRPAPLIFLRCPRILESHDIRERRRVDCYLPAAIAVGARSLETVVTDLSATGCRCRLKVAALAGAEIDLGAIPDTLSITLLQVDDEPEFILNAIVRNRHQDKDKIELGLAFKDLGDELRNRLTQYIENTGY